MLYNLTRKNVLARHIVTFRSTWRQARGLLFSRAKAGYAYVFPLSHPRRVSLHMFFVFHTIDVMYLRHGKVVELIHEFRPFTTYTPKHDADTVIELPAGMLRKTKTSRGNVIIEK
jgi:uncharacterized membrane protein (UPF0127 family)